MSTNLLEKTILNKIEELVKILIELSNLKNDDEKKELHNEGIDKCREIIPLLLHFLEGKEQYVEPMIYQLVREKLPEPIILNSFGQLQEELNFVVHKSIHDFKTYNEIVKPEILETETVEVAQKSHLEGNLQSENTVIDSKSTLYQCLAKAFPNSTIIENYKIRGQRIDYFIRELKLAFTAELTPYQLARLNYVCTQDNIKLFPVPKKLIKNPKKLALFIKTQKLS